MSSKATVSNSSPSEKESEENTTWSQEDASNSNRDLVDKLMLLHYEHEFCQSVKPPFKPITPLYFSSPSTVDNTNAQFYYFTSLACWLMSLAGHSVDKPGQFDDPNATATTIITEVRAMKLPIGNVAPNRLKQGSGDAVETILSALADKALATKNFTLEKLDYSKLAKFNELDEVGDVESNNNDLSDAADDNDVEDNVQVDSDDEDEVYVRAANDKTDTMANKEFISSGVNEEEWNLEVERVAPLLQIRPHLDDDWRGRLESATVLIKAVDKMYPNVKTFLERLGEEVDKSRERINKREQTLAQEFSQQVEEYRVKLRELNTSRDTANVASQSVQQLTIELNQLSETMEQVKRETEEHEAKISDSTPLMQVKAAVAKVKAEINQMALRIGVLQHSVLHFVMQHTRDKREGIAFRSDNVFDEDGMYSEYYYEYYEQSEAKKIE